MEVAALPQRWDRTLLNSATYFRSRVADAAVEVSLLSGLLALVCSVLANRSQG
jgi:hypothetical protein